MDLMKKCSICGSTFSRKWDTCIVCWEILCEECGIECDNCKRTYCIGKCGDDFIDEESYNDCFKCK